MRRDPETGLPPVLRTQPLRVALYRHFGPTYRDAIEASLQEAALADDLANAAIPGFDFNPATGEYTESEARAMDGNR